jgi:hypothetical protein
MDLKVDSATDLSLNIWKSNASDRLSYEQWADFNEAFQQIKFQIMAQGTAKGSPAVEQAALDAMNGQTVRSVLEMGLDWELQCLEAEKAQRLNSIKSNARMTTRPGDTESQLYLSHLRDQQLDLVNGETLQIDHVKGRLRAAGLPETFSPGSGKSVDTASEPGVEDAKPVLIR